MVLSKLLLRVLGLVIVVPRLACLEWPRLKPPTTGLTGLVGVVGEYKDDGDFGECPGDVLILVSVAGSAPDDIAFSSPAATPLGLTGGGGDSGFSAGVEGCDMIALPSSESASKSSGGSRSFSISDLRL